MTISHKRTLLGSILIFVGAVFLVLTFNQAHLAIRDILEFSFCITGYLSFVCAVAFGITGLCTILLAAALLCRAQT